MMLETALLVVTLTSYQPVPEQTDDTPFITSIGKRVNHNTIAVSQDLLEGRACYGDMVYIPGFGTRIVEDTMNIRYENAMDLLVFTKKEESRVGKRRGVKSYVIRSPQRRCTWRGLLYWRPYP